MNKHINNAVVYTAGRLAERESGIKFLWPKLCLKWVPYIFSSGYLGASQLGYVDNEPKYTLTAIGITFMRAAWKTYVFVKTTKSLQDDKDRLRVARCKLVGSGEDDAMLCHPTDVGQSQGSPGRLPKS